MKDIIHFSHANGFPAGSYKTLFSLLEPHFELGYIDRLGHHPEYPVTDNWGYLEQQLINELKSRYDRPVYAVGHSLGGVLSMMVASKHPELIKGLIMLDSPLITTFEARAVSVLKRVGMLDSFTPAGRTVGRKEEWQSISEAEDYFKGKKLFSRFDERCLRDYVNQATKQHENGRRLHFDVDTEIKIYRTIPHNLYRTQRLKMPSAVIGGRQSDVFKRQHAFKMKSQLGMEVHWLKGGHMFPMESPERTVNMIRELIDKWR
jgi:pimeloyl-ACP methyl ester carboxylesterase